MREKDFDLRDFYTKNLKDNKLGSCNYIKIVTMNNSSILTVIFKYFYFYNY